MSKAQYSLDISADTCPLTFVKTKLLLEKMRPGQIATIRLSRGEPLDNVPRTLREQGHAVLEIAAEEPDESVWRVLVQKAAG